MFGTRMPERMHRHPRGLNACAYGVALDRSLDRCIRDARIRIAGTAAMLRADAFENILIRLDGCHPAARTDVIPYRQACGLGQLRFIPRFTALAFEPVYPAGMVA